jgi:predicted cupin superfamily sugar epimerase
VDARQVIASLGLRPHPEGGWYAETWRASSDDGGRPAGTSIYFLLGADETSRWHRLDAPEVWHFHAGDPLELIVHDGRTRSVHRLGADLAAGDQPQAVVPADAWQSARSLGAWTLVGCTMAPGFHPAGFELAPDGWRPAATEP